MRVLLVVTVVVALLARTASARCYNDDACPSWQVCSVSLGACESGDGNADVCSGHCVAKPRFVFVPRLGASLVDGDAGALVGVEVFPPVFGNRLGIAVDYWTQSFLRAGVTVTWHAVNLVALGARIDVTRSEDITGAMGAIRVEATPIRQLPLSLFLEGGVSRANASTTPMGSVGIAVWL